MKVILQENVEGLGYLGDLLTVADGYARNYLLPRKMAVVANPRNLKTLEHLQRIATQKSKKELQGLEELAKKIAKVNLTFEVQTGKDDKLFGSVTSKDVAEALAEQGIEIDRRLLQMPQPIKELGAFSIPVKLHRDVIPQVSVSVVKKGGEEMASSESTESMETAGSSDQPQEEGA